MPRDDAVALYAFVASLALELAGRAAMMRADARAEIKVPTVKSRAQPVIGRGACRPFRQRETIFAGCVPRAKGERVTVDAGYTRHQRRCRDQKSTPLSAQAFAKSSTPFSEHVTLHTGWHQDLLPRCEAGRVRGKSSALWQGK
jgi:hypothetical protein